MIVLAVVLLGVVAMVFGYQTGNAILLIVGAVIVLAFLVAYFVRRTRHYDTPNDQTGG